MYGALQSQGTCGLLRGWNEVAADPVVLSYPEDSAPNASANLRCMASLILQSLRKDPRIRAIKERDHYWLATLLDPRYKGKVADLILPVQKGAEDETSSGGLAERSVQRVPKDWEVTKSWS